MDDQARYEAEYAPWSRVADIDVPVDGHSDFSHVRVPEVYAATAEAVTRTAQVMAFLVLHQIHQAQKAQEAPRAQKALAEATYEPPLVHFYCDSCQETWDAWVDEAGKLEDVRDVNCANGSCDRLGKPATLVTEEDA